MNMARVVCGAPCNNPDTAYRGPLFGTRGRVEVSPKKLIYKCALVGNDDGLDPNMMATPVKMVATPKLDQNTPVETPKI